MTGNRPEPLAGVFENAPFSVMVKPVGSACNMECGYCYYARASGSGGAGMMSGGVYMESGVRDAGGMSSVIRDMGRMTPGVLEAFVHSYIEADPGPEIYFTWHGGEPTLAGLDFYRSVVELQERYTPEGRRCINNLQTNGLLLDAEWCAFLSEARFIVGLSLDGAEWVHDFHRKDRSGAGTYSRVASAVKLMQSCGVQPDLLCTVTPQTAADPVAAYRALRAFDTGWIQFLPVVRRGADGGPAPESVSPDAYGIFLCGVFDEWIGRDLGRLNIQFFSEIARVLSGGAAGLCWMAPVCGRALVVEKDGGVYSCDHFVKPEYRLGDIQSAGLRELADSPRQNDFGNGKRDGLPARCRSCRWLDLCNGGCPKDRFATAEDGEPGLNYLCEGLRRFFLHAEQPLRQVSEFAKKGLDAGSIMNMLYAGEREKWKNIGRNDPCPCGSGRKAKNCCMIN